MNEQRTKANVEVEKFDFIQNKQEMDTLLSQLQFTINNMV